MMRKTTTVPLAELIEDFSIYPRHAIDPGHVGQLVLAMKAGAQLPPIVADRKTKRIVDGFHRVDAQRRVVGEAGTIEAELRDYPGEAELILDTIALNSAHGRRLDRADKTRCILLAERAGATLQQISVVLHVPEQKIESLRVRIAYAPAPGHGTVPGGREVSLKRSVSHLAGKEMTSEQVETHDCLPGTSFLLVAQQLRRALEADMVNIGDERLVSELRGLVTQLQQWLEALPVAA